MWLVLSICSRVGNRWSSNSLADKRWSPGSPQANVVLGENLQIHCCNNVVYGMSCPKGGTAQTKQLEEIWEFKLGIGGLCVVSITISVLKLLPCLFLRLKSTNWCSQNLIQIAASLSAAQLCYVVSTQHSGTWWSSAEVYWVCHPDVTLDNLRLKIKLFKKP